MTEQKEFQFNKWGVCPNGEEGYKYVSENHRQYAVLLAMDDTGLWYYGLDEGLGGYYPCIYRKSYANREDALQAGKEELLNKVTSSLDWYRYAAKVSISDEEKESYGVIVRELEKALQNINENLMTLF